MIIEKSINLEITFIIDILVWRTDWYNYYRIGIKKLHELYEENTDIPIFILEYYGRCKKPRIMKVDDKFWEYNHLP